MALIRLFAIVGERRKLRTGPTVDASPAMAKYADVIPRVPPWPRVVIVEAGWPKEAVGAMLYRYSAKRSFGGDTWHESVDAAKTQAEYEFAEALGQWTPVPEHVGDAIGYALRDADCN